MSFLIGFIVGLFISQDSGHEQQTGHIFGNQDLSGWKDAQLLAQQFNHQIAQHRSVKADGEKSK